MRRLTIGIALLGSVLWTAIEGWAQPPRYYVVDLGHGSPGYARDVTAAGRPVGHVGLEHSAKAVSWQMSDGPNHLLTPNAEGYNSQALGVNNHGRIAGWSNFKYGDPPQPGQEHACIWQHGALQWLEEPPVATGSQAYDVNDQGVAVGMWHTWPPNTYSVSGFHAVKWLADGSMIDLSEPDEYASRAEAINSQGQVVGMRRDARGRHAILWDEWGNPQNLGDLGTSGARATGINDAGHAVGYCRTDSIGTTPFFWDGEMRSLETFGRADDQFFPWDINANDAIVGTVLSFSGGIGSLTPVLWWEDEIYDLNTLREPFYSPIYGTMMLREVFAINDDGVIAASGQSFGPYAATRPYLLVPVPEPSTLVLLIVGAVGFLICAGRSRLLHNRHGRRA